MIYWKKQQAKEIFEQMILSGRQNVLEKKMRTKIGGRKMYLILPIGVLLLLILTACDKEQPIQMSTIYIKTLDSVTELGIDSNISLNGITSRTLEGNWASIDVPTIQNLSIKGCIGNSQYYEKQSSFETDNQDKRFIKIYCRKKSESVMISTKEIIKEGKNNANLTISLNEGYLDLNKICEKHSARISYVYLNGNRNVGNCIDLKANISVGEPFAFSMEYEAYNPDYRDYVDILAYDNIGRKFEVRMEG